MKVFVINGLPTSGKTTFKKFFTEEANKRNKEVFNTSIIDIVKDLASSIGWDGGKTPEDRRFLSDFKSALTKWKDIPFKSLVTMYDSCKKNNDYMLIDARSPEDIERIKKEFNAKTVLIHKDELVNDIQSNYDDNSVYDTNYDYIIYNNGDLKSLHDSAIIFIESLEKENFF